ncbi:restriction endonuclease subunit S [Komagataeibacter sp. SM21]|uniref:restriction endonuclease subunit S n=1 Tax=Komagataeibacter sp. SM21 TaxID=3242899 RepID=UPI00352763F5
MTFIELPLSKVLSFHNGKKPPELVSAGYPVFGSNGPIGLTKAFNHENAVILGRVGAYCGSVEYCEGRFWASDNTIVVKPLDGFDAKYLYYSLKNQPLRSYAGGAAQPLITHGILKPIKAKYHGQGDQKRIANILSAYDDLIENNRRRIALLEEAARQLYKEWFVRFRFPGHEHVKIIDGVPEGWEPTRLGNLVSTNSRSYSAKSIPEHLRYIDISAVNKGEITLNSPISSEEAPGRARRIARHGDVIWSNVRPNLRAYALVMNPDEIDVFSTGFTVLSSAILPFSFLYLHTTTDAFVNYLMNHTTGASYPAVRPDDFERAEMIMPPENLLIAFHELCEPNFEMMAVLRQQADQLAKARDLLIPKLMSGTLTV